MRLWLTVTKYVTTNKGWGVSTQVEPLKLYGADIVYYVLYFLIRRIQGFNHIP